MILRLCDTLLYEMAVELYGRHRDDGSGRCAVCGGAAPCPSRCHAAGVLEAAGADVAVHDAGGVPAVGVGAFHPRGRAETVSAHTGYWLGGRDPRVNPEGYFPDRDR